MDGQQRRGEEDGAGGLQTKIGEQGATSPADRGEATRMDHQRAARIKKRRRFFNRGRWTQGARSDERSQPCRATAVRTATRPVGADPTEAQPAVTIRRGAGLCSSGPPPAASQVASRLSSGRTCSFSRLSECGRRAKRRRLRIISSAVARSADNSKADSSIIRGARVDRTSSRLQLRGLSSQLVGFSSPRCGRRSVPDLLTSGGSVNELTVHVDKHELPDSSMQQSTRGAQFRWATRDGRHSIVYALQQRELRPVSTRLPDEFVSVDGHAHTINAAPAVAAAAASPSPAAAGLPSAASAPAAPAARVHATAYLPSWLQSTPAATVPVARWRDPSPSVMHMLGSGLGHAHSLKSSLKYSFAHVSRSVDSASAPTQGWTIVSCVPPSPRLVCVELNPGPTPQWVRRVLQYMDWDCPPELDCTSCPEAPLVLCPPLPICPECAICPVCPEISCMDCCNWTAAVLPLLCVAFLSVAGVWLWILVYRRGKDHAALSLEKRELEIDFASSKVDATAAAAAAVSAAAAASAAATAAVTAHQDALRAVQSELNSSTAIWSVRQNFLENELSQAQSTIKQNQKEWNDECCRVRESAMQQQTTHQEALRQLHLIHAQSTEHALASHTAAMDALNDRLTGAVKDKDAATDQLVRVMVQHADEAKQRETAVSEANKSDMLSSDLSLGTQTWRGLTELLGQAIDVTATDITHAEPVFKLSHTHKIADVAGQSQWTYPEHFTLTDAAATSNLASAFSSSSNSAGQSNNGFRTNLSAGVSLGFLDGSLELDFRKDNKSASSGVQAASHASTVKLVHHYDLQFNTSARPGYPAHVDGCALNEISTHKSELFSREFLFAIQQVEYAHGRYLGNVTPAPGSVGNSAPPTPHLLPHTNVLLPAHATMLSPSNSSSAAAAAIAAGGPKPQIVANATALSLLPQIVRDSDCGGAPIFQGLPFRSDSAGERGFTTPSRTRKDSLNTMTASALKSTSNRNSPLFFADPANAHRTRPPSGSISNMQQSHSSPSLIAQRHERSDSPAGASIFSPPSQYSQHLRSNTGDPVRVAWLSVNTDLTSAPDKVQLRQTLDAAVRHLFVTFGTDVCTGVHLGAKTNDSADSRSAEQESSSGSGRSFGAKAAVSVGATELAAAAESERSRESSRRSSMDRSVTQSSSLGDTSARPSHRTSMIIGAIFKPIDQFFSRKVQLYVADMRQRYIQLHASPGDLCLTLVQDSLIHNFPMHLEGWIQPVIDRAQDAIRQVLPKWQWVKKHHLTTICSRIVEPINNAAAAGGPSPSPSPPSGGLGSPEHQQQVFADLHVDAVFFQGRRAQRAASQHDTVKDSEPGFAFEFKVFDQPKVGDCFIRFVCYYGGKPSNLKTKQGLKTKWANKPGSK